MSARDWLLVMAAALAVVGWGMQRTGHLYGTVVCLASVGLALSAWAFF